jgi:hypothetical protein
MLGAVVHPKAVFGNASVTVSWSRTMPWLMPFAYPINNIWYYSSRLVPMFHALRRNATNTLPFSLPPFGAEDVVLVPQAQRKFDMEWQNTARHAALGVNVTVAYKDGEWWSALSPANVVCFRNAVATGVFPYVVRRRCLRACLASRATRSAASVSLRLISPVESRCALLAPILTRVHTLACVRACARVGVRVCVFACAVGARMRVVAHGVDGRRVRLCHRE